MAVGTIPTLPNPMLMAITISMTMFFSITNLHFHKKGGLSKAFLGGHDYAPRPNVIIALFLSKSDAMLRSSQSKYAFTNIMDKGIDTIHLIIERS